MKIFTLWSNSDTDVGDAPWIADAVDEYTVEAHGDFPEEYAKKRAQADYRELIIDVPERSVHALFGSPKVIAKVVES